jgi:hypothetical protein
MMVRLRREWQFIAIVHEWLSSRTASLLPMVHKQSEADVRS